MGSKLNAKGIVGNSVEEYRGIGLTCGSRESLWGPDMVSWKRNMTQAKAAAQFGSAFLSHLEHVENRKIMSNSKPSESKSVSAHDSR